MTQSISKNDAAAAQTDIKAEVDDERRDVPPGWARAFDKQAGRHFYAPIKQSDSPHSVWVHPYDSAAYVATLSPDHPAHPDSPAAQAYRQRSATEQAEHAAAAKSGKKKGWLAKTIGNLKGEGPSYDEKLHQKDAEEKFVRRREALKQGDLRAYGTDQKYTQDPFAFPAPAEPFNRTAENEVRYAYGYQGLYQRKYTAALGYGQAEPEGAGMSKAVDWYLHGADTPVAGRTKVANYGF